MKSRVLFVTKGESADFGEGFSYAAELARISEGGVFVLFHYNREGLGRLEDEMSAAAMAQHGDLGTARQILSERDERIKKDASQKVRVLQSMSKGGGLVTEHSWSTDEVISAIEKILQNNPALEIVILSPSLMDSDRKLSFKKLRRKISRPVVTMSRPARV